MNQERYLEKIYVQARAKPSDVIAIKGNCLCEYYHIRCFTVAKTFYCNSLKRELSSVDDPEYVYALNVIQNPTFKHFIISLHNILGPCSLLTSQGEDGKTEDEDLSSRKYMLVTPLPGV